MVGGGGTGLVLVIGDVTVGGETVDEAGGGGETGGDAAGVRVTGGETTGGDTTGGGYVFYVWKNGSYAEM